MVGYGPSSPLLTGQKAIDQRLLCGAKKGLALDISTTRLHDSHGLGPSSSCMKPNNQKALDLIVYR